MQTLTYTLHRMFLVSQRAERRRPTRPRSCLCTRCPPAHEAPVNPTLHASLLASAQRAGATARCRDGGSAATASAPRVCPKFYNPGCACAADGDVPVGTVQGGGAAAAAAARGAAAAGGAAGCAWSLRLRGRTCRCDGHTTRRADRACPCPCCSVELCGRKAHLSSIQAIHMGVLCLVFGQPEALKDRSLSFKEPQHGLSLCKELPAFVLRPRLRGSLLVLLHPAIPHAHALRHSSSRVARAVEPVGRVCARRAVPGRAAALCQAPAAAGRRRTIH